LKSVKCCSFFSDWLSECIKLLLSPIHITHYWYWVSKITPVLMTSVHGWRFNTCEHGQWTLAPVHTTHPCSRPVNTARECGLLTWVLCIGLQTAVLITDIYCGFAVVTVCTVWLDSWLLLYTQYNVNSGCLYFGHNSSCGWCILFVGDCLTFHLKSLPKQRGHLILWISLTPIQNVTSLHPLVCQFSFISRVLL